LKHLLEALPPVAGNPQVDFYVSIENGLTEVSENQWLDIGWIILVDSKTNRQFSGSSGGVIFETKFVEEAKRIGWKTMTAGEVMSKELKCDSKDPHSFLTNQRVSRCQFLEQALLGLIGQWERTQQK